jgi:hypothetical protein
MNRTVPNVLAILVLMVAFGDPYERLVNDR